jgi:hypothetical protein
MCDRTDQIDVAVNVHVKVSYAKECGVAVKNHIVCIGAIKMNRFKNIILSDLFIEYYL